MKIKLERITDEYHREASWEMDWPAVPRAGEYIELTDSDDPSGDRVTGTVRIVMWGDDGVPLVRFR